MKQTLLLIITLMFTLSSLCAHLPPDVEGDQPADSGGLAFKEEIAIPIEEDEPFPVTTTDFADEDDPASSEVDQPSRRGRAIALLMTTAVAIVAGLLVSGANTGSHPDPS